MHALAPAPPPPPLERPSSRAAAGRQARPAAASATACARKAGRGRSPKGRRRQRFGCPHRRGGAVPHDQQSLGSPSAAAPGPGHGARPTPGPAPERGRVVTHDQQRLPCRHVHPEVVQSARPGERAQRLQDGHLAVQVHLRGGGGGGGAWGRARGAVEQAMVLSKTDGQKAYRPRWPGGQFGQRGGAGRAGTASTQPRLAHSHTRRRTPWPRDSGTQHPRGCGAPACIGPGCASAGRPP